MYRLGLEDQVSLESQLPCSDCGGSAVVGLHPTRSDHRVAALLNGISQQELQFTGLQ